MKKTSTKFIHGAIALLSITLMFLVHPLTAQAAGFDPVYYAQKYPDVAAAVGTSQKALINHYCTCGVYEGRYQNAQEEAEDKPLNTYIDIDLENQHVTYILDGNVVFEADCVSGDVSKNRQTAYPEMFPKTDRLQPEFMQYTVMFQAST